MPPEDRDRLLEQGLGSDEIDALALLWDCPRFADLLADTPRNMKVDGFGLADCFDAVFHRLDADDATLYLRNGFTAHQAELIEVHPHAARNLRDRPLDSLLDILESALPREFIVNALLAAQSPADIDDYISRYLAAPSLHDANVIGAEVAMFAGYKANPLTCCG